jgi:hypothetical protein
MGSRVNRHEALGATPVSYLLIQYYYYYHLCFHLSTRAIALVHGSRNAPISVAPTAADVDISQSVTAGGCI